MIKRNTFFLISAIAALVLAASSATAGADDSAKPKEWTAKLGANDAKARIRVPSATELELAGFNSADCIAAIRRLDKLTSFTALEGAEVDAAVLIALGRHSATLERLTIRSGELQLTSECLAALAKLTQLTYLEIEEFALVDVAPEAARRQLVALSRLRELVDESDELVKLVPLKGLRVYRGGFVSEDTLVPLTAAAQLTVLTAIRFGLHGESFRLLTMFQTLESLELLSNASLHEVTPEEVRQLGKLRTLKHLVLEELPIEFDYVADALLTLDSLESLTLRYMAAMTESAFAKLATLESLQRVELVFNQSDQDQGVLPEKGVVALCKAPQLRELYLWNNGVAALSSEVLAKIADVARLRVFEVNFDFSDVGSSFRWDASQADTVLSRMGANSNLTRLSVPRGATKSFRALGPMPHLATLDAFGLRPLSRADVEKMLEFKSLSRIEELDATQCHPWVGEILGKSASLREIEVHDHSNAGNEKLIQFLSGFPAGQLRGLTVTAGKCDDALLRAVVRHTSLESLRLYVEEELSPRHIAALATLRNLRHLDLWIYDDLEPGEVCSAISTLKSLRSLDLNYFTLGDEGLNILAQKTSLQSLRAGLDEVDLSTVLNVYKSHPNLRLIQWDSKSNPD